MYIIFFILNFLVILLLSIKISHVVVYANFEYSNKSIQIVKHILGDVKIEEYKCLHNFDGSLDYLYVKLEHGYAIFYIDTMELLEYSLDDNSAYENTSDIYYGGPCQAYIKESDKFIDIHTRQSFFVSINELHELSSNIRNEFKRHTTQNVSVVDDLNISSGNNNINNVPAMSGNISADSDGISNTTYISNYQYFYEANPTHGTNSGDQCGSVAVQLLLGYNNYYVDRRIIPVEYLNGGWNTENNDGNVFNADNYSSSNQNPYVCDDPTMLNAFTAGSNDNYYNLVVEKVETNYDGTHALDLMFGIHSLLDDRIGRNSFSLMHRGWLFATAAMDTDAVTDEIDDNRPLIILLRSGLGALDHWCVAYGYAQYTYEEGDTHLGYIVHMGWDSNYNRVWVNHAWCSGSISFMSSHEHSLEDSGITYGTTKREVRCSDCNYRTLDDLFTVSEDGSTITGCNYPNGDIIVPYSINGIPITSIADGVFANCLSLESVEICSPITTISDNLFYGCDNLTSITLPSTVTSIGDCAFQNCSSLTDITLPSGLTYLGEGAFRNCGSIESITLPSGLTEINSYTFDGCTSLSGTINMPTGITDIGNYAFRNCNINIWFGFLSSLTHIGAYAFYNNDSITSVIIPEGVDSVGDYAFAECDHLSFVAFNNPGINLYMYVDLVFENCPSISQILFQNELLAQYHINYTNTQNLREKITFDDPLTWTLITDAPSSLYNAYFTGYTFSQVIDMPIYHENHLPTIPANTGIIFFTCGTELYPSLFLIELMEFYDYPIVVISPNLRHDEINYNDYIPVLSKDMFSAGYKIGSIMKDENEYEIEHIDDVGGFFPIIATEYYKNNIAFLMGISCGLTVPVQVISSEDDIDSQIFETNWSLIENWACVGFDAESHNMINTLLNYAQAITGYSNIYLFSTSESYISAMSNTYDNTYLIKDKQFDLTQIVRSFFFDEELDENFYYDMQFNDYDGVLEPELMYDVWYPLWDLYLGYQFDEDSYADFYYFASNIVLVEQLLISGNDISE